MYPFYFWNAVGEFFLFLLVVFTFFYLPGKWILTKLHLKLLTPEHVVIPVAVGMMAFTLAAYITSWFHASLLLYIPLAAIFFIERKSIIPRSNIDKKHFLPFLVVILVSLLFSLPRTLGGIWGNTFSYGGDDILHLSYMHELRAHFPPDVPAFAHTPLKGYHFFSDFFIAKVNELSGISIESLYYHFIPILVVLLLGFGIYSLMFTWTKRVSAALWAVFLCEFGGSFGFIILLQGHTGISLASVFGIDQPASAMLNSPFAFSLVLVTAALLLLYHYSQTQKIGWLWLLAILVGLSPLFKIYAGIVLFGGLTALTILELFQKRLRVIVPYLTALVLALVTYGVFSGSGNYITFFPLWPPHRMLQANFPWYGYDEKMYTFSRLHVIHGIVETEAHGLILFFFGNLGTRILGICIAAIVWLLKRRKTPSVFALTVAAMMATAILIPMFFIQSVKVFEIIQMTWYYPFFAALFAAYGFGYLNNIKIPIIRWLLVAAIIVVTLPSAYEIFTNYVFTPRVRAPLSSFALYEYLRSHGSYDDTVLELPPPSVENTKQKIIAWYETSSSKFAAFADKRSYFNSLEIDFPNLDIDGRALFLQQVRELATSSGSLSGSDILALKNKLLDKGIKYLYSPYKIPPLSPATPIQEIFTSSGEFMYKIN